MSADSWRTTALIAAIVGAAASMGFMIRAGGSRSLLLVVLFTGWILSPYVALIWALTSSASWWKSTRPALSRVTLVVVAGSVAAFAFPAWRPAGARPAFSFLMVPLGSWLLIVVVVAITAMLARPPRSAVRR